MTHKDHDCPDCNKKKLEKKEYDEEALTEEDLKDIEKSIKEIEEGKFTTQKEMKRKYGL